MTKKHHHVVNELSKLIIQNKWESAFNEALKRASSYNVPLIGNIKTIEGGGSCG